MPSYSLLALAYQLKLHIHLRVGGRTCALCGALLTYTLTLEKAFVRILDLCGEKKNNKSRYGYNVLIGYYCLRHVEDT